MPRPERVRLLRQFLEPEVVSASQGVRFGKRDDEPHPARRLRGQSFRLQWKADEPDVDMTCPKGGDLGLRRQILKDDFHRRGVLGEETKDRTQEKPVGLRGNADGELERLAPRRVPRDAGGALRRGENAARLVEKSLTRRSQRDPPLGSKKEIDLELALEISNLLAQGRLGGVEPARRMAEMKLFRDRDE